MHAVAEAARNLACVGATPLALTNNLNFGNPTRSDVYYQMSRSVEGLAEGCLALSTPVTGGNVSLYNQYRTEAGVKAVYPTLTVGMVGVLPDATQVSPRPASSGIGDVVMLVGDNTDELGASEYLAQVHGLEIGHPPQPRPGARRGRLTRGSRASSKRACATPPTTCRTAVWRSRWLKWP